MPNAPADTPFSPIEDLLSELRAGRMIVLTDDEDRENEGDLVLPAQFVTPQAITFMLAEAKGYLCLSLTEEDCHRLDLPPQASVNTSVRGTPFTVSIDGHPRHGFTTGVSAAERARCIRLAIDPHTTPADFVRPGHINPLRSRDGGVLVRTGQTEGSVDLCRLAGLTPAAVIIEIMRPDGEMARVPDLIEFCRTHNLKMGSVAQIIEHRLARESLVRRLDPKAGARISTAHGEFNLIAFESVVDPLPHLALTVGGVGDLDDRGHPLPEDRPTLVRMHRRNLLGDIFAQHAPGASPSRDVLDASMRMIQREGRGAIVYLRPESGGGDERYDHLVAIKRTGAGAPDAPDLTSPTSIGASAVPMRQREFGIGGQILRELGLTRLRLITSSPKTMPGLDAFGLDITEILPPARD